MTFFRNINRLAKRLPAVAAAVTWGGRYGFGDIVVQSADGRGAGREIDHTRWTSFAAFGAFYGSIPGYLVYNKLYPYALGAARPALTVAVDLCTNCPFLYFPAFYIVREFIYTGVERSIAEPRETIMRGVDRWKGNFWEDAKICALFWGPVNFFNFKFVFMFIIEIHGLDL